MLPAVIGGHLVGEHRIRLKRAETVGKAWRHPQLATVIRRQFDRDPAAVTGRTGTDIDGNVEQRAGHAPDKFALRERLALKVKTAHRPDLGAQRFILLDEVHLADCLGQQIGAIGFGKIAARVAMPVSTYIAIPVSGTFTMVSWAPPGARDYLLMSPMVNTMEMIRYGLFGDYVESYYNVWNPILVSAVFMMIGLVLCRRVRRNLVVE